MRIARILYPVTVLGPGKRIAIWAAGCSKRCQGCANPELWEGQAYPEIELHQLKAALDALFEKAEGQVDGITISGGEPFEQAEELFQLVSYLKEKTEDILIFSGRKREELLQDMVSSCILNEIAVLVDGAYIESQNEGEVLRGSQNQTIHILDENVRQTYDTYLAENKGKHLVENFRVSDGVIAVGIHKKDFKQALKECLEKKHMNVITKCNT